MTDRNRELLDHVGVTRVQQHYADIVSRRAWDELREVFLPGAEVVVAVGGQEPITLAAPDEFADFVGRSVAQFDFFQFLLLNTHIETSVGGDPDHATARMWMSELRQWPEVGNDTPGEWSVVYGVYHDHYRRVDGRWWFASRKYDTLARTSTDPARAFDLYPFPTDPRF